MLPGNANWVWLTGLLLIGTACTSTPHPRTRGEQKENRMESLDQHIAEKLIAFESERQTAFLQEALEAIGSAGQEAAVDKAAPKRQLSRWVRFFEALDQHIDPEWDANQVPETGIIPPPTDGKAYFSGVDPSAIADPAARAQYEEALAASQDDADRYRIQLELRRIDERSMRQLREWLGKKYAGSAALHKEFTDALSGARMSTGRKERLQALLPE